MGLEREWMRGAGALAVLTLLDRREMYGYEIVTALDAESQGLLEMGQSTVYPLLYSLERRGFVDTTSRVASSGRRRKYYRLTEAGQARLEKQRTQWATLVEALSRLGLGPGKQVAVEVPAR